MTRADTYHLLEKEGLAHLLDEALNNKQGLCLIFATQRAAIRKRLHLYRYRSAFEAQTRDYSYRDITFSLRNVDSEWHLLLYNNSYRYA